MELVFVSDNGGHNGHDKSSKGRILVVDRDTNVRATVESLLTIAGCDVTTAGSAAAGLRFVRVWSPQLILLDPTVRGRNPLAVVRAFWDAGRGRIPLIVLADDTVRARADLKPMISDSLAKPFDVRDLLDLAARYVTCKA